MGLDSHHCGKHVFIVLQQSFGCCSILVPVFTATTNKEFLYCVIPIFWKKTDIAYSNIIVLFPCINCYGYGFESTFKVWPFDHDPGLTEEFDELMSNLDDFVSLLLPRFI